MDQEPAVEIQALLEAAHERPYSPTLRLKLANAYSARGYPDLAAGEAYLCLLLAAELRESFGEYHTETLSAARSEAADWCESFGDLIQEFGAEGEDASEIWSKVVEREAYVSSSFNVLRFSTSPRLWH